LNNISLERLLLALTLQLDNSFINPYSIPAWYPARKKLLIEVKIIKIINLFFQLLFKKNKEQNNNIR
jgi:hypothetical protein